MIAHTIAIPHTKIKGTATNIETISLIVLMTEGMPRPRKSRIVKVAIMPTM